MHKRFGLILCKIEKARLHDYIGVLTVTESPCRSLGLFVDLAFDRARDVGSGVVIGPGYNPVFVDCKLQ